MIRTLFRKQADIKYFKNLDGLRFLAALAVIMGHCQNHLMVEARRQLGDSWRVYAPFADKLANFGVDFFYVLSGFLISYLLMMEVDKTQTIKVKFFYYRRFLRIWPLYFIVGIVALIFGQYFVQLFHYNAVIPYTFKDFYNNLFFLGTFTVNIQTLIGYQTNVSSLMVGHFWSLGVEEQYYLIFAPIMYIFRKKLWIPLLLFIAIGFYFNNIPLASVEKYYGFHYYFTLNRFFHFGVGGLLAYIIRYVDFSFIKIIVDAILVKTKATPSVWHWVHHKNTHIAAVILLQLYFIVPMAEYLFGPYYYSYERNYHGWVSVVIIWSAITYYSVFDVLVLENKVIRYLGRISFGIYVFHYFFHYFTYWLLEKIGYYPFGSDFIMIYPILTTLFTVAVSAASYEWIEKPFLKLKHKFK